MAILSMTVRWRERNGGQSSLHVTHPESEEAVLAAARRMGYPGHPGTPWDYLKGDLRALRQRLWSRNA